eukprot:CAMPEP_0197197966 /NCGR_PEP_ID=MMETSP1423-20130617/33134_1 /TAXON_ID=476441 /ORGANISM="Pseudo-nitzschia heimii, Strain UNC1101" /LENGTH=630 /DNA_ID=CAMNT_0042651795 /DNA_START=159 /DNA_END=2051 /DNA_ORIENTATION=-
MTQFYEEEMKKNLYRVSKTWNLFSSITIVYIFAFVSLLYGTLSIITLTKQNEYYHSRIDPQPDQEPHPTDKNAIETSRAGMEFLYQQMESANLAKTNKINLVVGGNISRQRPPGTTIVQTLETHFTKLFPNTTIENKNHWNDTLKTMDTLQRKRQHVLEVLIGYFSKISKQIDSDIVELRHCRLEILDYSKFSSWAAVILLDAWPTIEGKLKRNTEEVRGLSRSDDWDGSMYLEFCLGLLEIYATHSSGEGNGTICDFGKYPLTIQGDHLLFAKSILQSVPVSPDGLPRLVFVIIAFEDADHLESLINACFLPHHLFVVHLERRSPSSFTERVHRIANKFANVAIVQFGSIIYRTDSVSMVNYRIMYWLTEELGVSYDFFLTLGNAVYPLYSAEELTNHFKTTKQDIWLGELRNNRQGGRISSAYLKRKRLVFTAGDQKYTQRTKVWAQNGFDSSIPDYIETNMTEKTNSGNQAVFSYRVVKKLIKSTEVKELFSMAKYGCCCCLEERTWIAAAKIIGYGDEAMGLACMFQVWGGEPVCGDGSLKNALLIPNATICYRSDDLTKGNLSDRQRNGTEGPGSVEYSYFRGDKLLEELSLAKKRGFLFARKFASRDERSLKLIEMIQQNIHQN